MTGRGRHWDLKGKSHLIKNEPASEIMDSQGIENLSFLLTV